MDHDFPLGTGNVIVAPEEKDLSADEEEGQQDAQEIDGPSSFVADQRDVGEDETQRIEGDKGEGKKHIRFG